MNDFFEDEDSVFNIIGEHFAMSWPPILGIPLACIWLCGGVFVSQFREAGSFFIPKRFRS